MARKVKAVSMHELIRASAGSGKTFQLSGHFLRQLFLGNAPETILATTFTRKAAGEILGRVLLRLAGAAQDKKECAALAEFMQPAKVTQKLSQELLVSVTSQLHRMRVCTLDSFFQQVARSLTLELGLPPGWNIVDEHVDRELREQAIDAVLAQQMPKDSQRLMQMLAKGHSKRSVRDLIDNTVRQFHELYLLTDADAWQKIPQPSRLTKKAIEDARRDIASQTPYDSTRIVKAVREDMERFDGGQWEVFIAKGLAGKIFNGDHTYYRKPLPEGLVEAYEPLVTHARAELLSMVAQQTKATYQLIDRFDTEYSRLRAEHGWMGFNDVTRILSRSSEAASGERMNFRLDSALDHLLLDEFQDTSPDQWSILKRLAVNVTATDESSFFCVGDPKQAIYGWRGGVAEILDAVEATIPEIESRSLDESRRSSVAVIDTVNRVFQHLSEHNNLSDYGPACFQWQQGFPEHTTFHRDVVGFTQLRTSPQFEGDSSEERRVGFYSWVAQQIRDLHNQCPASEIGVLTRKNHTVARLVHELNLLGVPASEEGGTAPTDSPAVLAVLSLLHLASHPGCGISRFHVATSPLNSLVNLTTWTDDVAAKASASEIRERLMDDGYGRTLQWISEAIRPACSQRDLLRLRQIVAEGWKFDQSPSLNPSDFVALLENSKLSKKEVAPVRVMTVHQSKGLEFDIVVLPELEGKLFRPPSAAARSPEPGAAPDEVCVWRNKAIRSLLPKSLQQAFQETIAGDVSEALCLLYVALTRAVHALHMLMPPLSSDKTPASFAGVLLASLTEDRCAPPDSILFESGRSDWYAASATNSATTATNTVKNGAEKPRQRVVLPAISERRRGLRRETPSKHDDGKLRLPSSRTSSGGSITARLDPRVRGTVVHAWFEQIDWLDMDGLPDMDVLRKISADHFVDEATTEQLLTEFSAWIQQPGTQSALSYSTASTAPAFAAYAAELESGDVTLRVHNERPFVLKHNGAIVQGTIDRVVIATQKGNPIAADIIDFKTDALRGKPKAWAKEKLSHYGPQLEIYHSALEHCFNVPASHISSRLILLECDIVIGAGGPKSPGSSASSGGNRKTAKA